MSENWLIFLGGYKNIEQCVTCGLRESHGKAAHRQGFPGRNSIQLTAFCWVGRRESVCKVLLVSFPERNFFCGTCAEKPMKEHSTISRAQDTAQESKVPWHLFVTNYRRLVQAWAQRCFRGACVGLLLRVMGILSPFQNWGWHSWKETPPVH